MKIALIVFPGTNREMDMEKSIHQVSVSQSMESKGIKTHIQKIWHKDTKIDTPDLIILPGGFSYGDYLRCGAMAAHSPVMREVIEHAGRGTPILGVCNGFQMLVETRILPGALLKNKTLKFICKRTPIRAENTDTMFTGALSKGQVLNVPIAHGEGNYFAQPDQIKELEDESRIAFRYCNDNGEITDQANPNGSASNIAGVMNKRRTILGMMPHPEDAVLDHQNPKDGYNFFKGILESLCG